MTHFARPAGLHAVTAGQDCVLNVWDVAAKSVVASRTTPDTVSDMAWQPGANALLCITESSGIILWSDVLPKEMREPSPSAERHARASDGDGVASLCAAC